MMEFIELAASTQILGTCWINVFICLSTSRCASAGSPEPARDANQDGWCVSVEVEEQEIHDELKKGSCYYVVEQRRRRHS
jgi:hypothetical protein